MAEQFNAIGDQADDDEECPELEELCFDPPAETTLTEQQQTDIEVVVQQAGVSKSKAIAALERNDWDLVEAIMNLSK